MLSFGTYGMLRRNSQWRDNRAADGHLFRNTECFLARCMPVMVEAIGLEANHDVHFIFRIGYILCVAYVLLVASDVLTTVDGDN